MLLTTYHGQQVGDHPAKENDIREQPNINQPAMQMIPPNPKNLTYRAQIQK
jgi:hypothetical protein